MQKLNFLIILIGFTVALWACNQSPKSGVENNTASIDTNLEIAKLADYQKFLSQLDTNEMTNIPKAAAYFTTAIKSASVATNDSAYAMFSEFHQMVGFRVEEKIVMKDMEGFFGVINDNSRDDLKPMVAKIKENGFRLGIVEGSIYVTTDFAFQHKYFYDAFSPAMQAYFSQEQKEDQEGFADDGGLLVSPKVIAERIVFWEKYNARYPDFLWKRKVMFSIKSYTSVVFNGMDNSPVFYEDKLDSAYQVAYLFLKNENPQTEIGKKATQYLQLLDKNKGKDSPEAKEYRGKTAPWE